MAAAEPLAVGYGPGAETRAPLARSIIGGIFLSTLVTLVIVPIFYVLFDRFGAWVYGLTRRDEPAGHGGPGAHGGGGPGGGAGGGPPGGGRPPPAGGTGAGAGPGGGAPGRAGRGLRAP